MKKYIKKFNARYKSLPTKSRNLLTLGIVVALVLALGLFVYALQTQNLELREKAQTPAYPTNVCWNLVSDRGDSLNWPDGCRGVSIPDGLCTKDVPPLTQQEIQYYNAWVAAGRPAIPGCATATRQNACNSNSDCRCGRDPNTNQCTIANKDYVTGFCTTPDFCSGFSGRCAPGCVNNTCQLICPEASTSPSPSASVNPSPTIAASASPSPSPPTTQIMRFQVKFAGVTDDKASGAKITVRFIKGSYDRITSPFAVNHIGNGVYEGQIDLSANPVVVGDGYTFFVKGEKHLARKFCQLTGQSERCAGQGNIAVFGGDTLYGFQLLSLDPGDLPSQDGAANANDFTKIKNLLTKSCSTLTAEEKLTADLDYSGCINIRDAFLMRQTLETRFDE